LKYNPDIHHRRSIRLKGYDYSQTGAYFVTICVQNKECLFGKIIEGKVVLNSAGIMIEKWYNELNKKFKGMSTCYVIMPNHFHAIIDNCEYPSVDLCVCHCDATIESSVGADLRVCPNNGAIDTIQGGHIGPPLQTVIQWFKTMTTNEYIQCVKNHGWKPFKKRLWQRNYYEHIIRDDAEYNRIAEYIVNNPFNWRTDSLWID